MGGWIGLKYQNIKILISSIFLGLLLFSNISISQENIMNDTPDQNIDTKNSLFFKDVANELRCPTCQGLSILESDAKFSVQMKNIVESKINSGWEKDKILTYFTERYGPWILRTPPKKGFSLLAWIVPVSLFILGPFLLWIFIWRKKTTITTFGARSTEKILLQMNEELSKLKNKRGSV